MAYQLKRNDWDLIWDSHLKRYVHSEPKRAKMLQELIERMKVEVQTVIELGCGSLRDSGFLSQHYEVFGLDFNKKVLTETKNIYPKCHRVVASVFTLPFKDNSIDISFSSGLLIYFNNKDVVRIVEEQVRVTKKLALFFVHNKTNFWEIPIVKVRGIRDKLYRFRRFSRKELFKLLRKYGEAVKIISFGTTHPFYVLSWNRPLYLLLKKFGFDKKLKRLHCTTEWCVVIDLRMVKMNVKCVSCSRF